MSFRHAYRRTVDIAGLTVLVGVSVLALAEDPVGSATLPRPGLGLINEVHPDADGLRCSVTGFAPDVIPTRALIRRPSGETAVVSFDRGWRIYQADGLTRLVAVCIEDDQPSGDAVGDTGMSPAAMGTGLV